MSTHFLLAFCQIQRRELLYQPAGDGKGEYLTVHILSEMLSIILYFVCCICIFNPTFINSILPLVIGVWIVIKSITSLQLALNIKNTGYNNWQMMLLLSILTFILGIVIVLNPFQAMEAVVSICGGFLLVSEIINVFETVYMMRMMK